MYCAQKAVDTAISDIVSGQLKLPVGDKWVKRAKAEAASAVREQNERHMKAEMIKNVQQLRLREPDMVRKEYRALVK